MVPGIGFSELLLLGVIALLVVGPRDLPLMMRKLGRQMARLRALANEFRSGFDELARQAELDELKREVEALRRGQTFTDPVIDDIERDLAGIAAPVASPADAPAGEAPPTDGAAAPASAPAEAPAVPLPDDAEPLKVAR